MPKATYARCRECGAHREHVGLLSRTRLCTACSHRLLHENVDGLHFHRGYAFDRWRVGMARTVLPPDVVTALAQAGLLRLEP